MTLVNQIVDPSFDYFSSERVSALKVWQKAVDKVTSVDLSVLAFHLVREHNDKRKAQSAIDYFIDCWRRAEKLGINTSTLKKPVVKESIMMISDLEGWLQQMSVPRRRCFLYALLSEQNLTEVMEMTWKQYMSQWRQVPEFCRDIVQMIPRHIHSDLVFYEIRNGKPLALSGLEFESLMITGKPWVELLESSQNVILDNEDSLTELLKFD